MSKIAMFFGNDITSRVISYGSSDQSKEILLAKSQMVTSSYSLVVRNDDGAFSPYLSGSLYKGRNFYGKDLEVTWDGNTVFEGVLRNIVCSVRDKTATIYAESPLSDLGVVTFAASGQAENPVDSALSWLTAAGFGALTDVASFSAAAGLCRDAGASFDYEYKESDNKTVLAALDEVSDLAGVSFYEKNGLIHAKSFRKYQGSGAELKFEINSTNVREFDDWQWQIDAYYNRISIAFGSGSFYTEDDLESQAKVANGKVVPRTIGNDVFKAHDLISAKFFAMQFLSRTSYAKATLGVAVGSEFQGSNIGDRHKVTLPHLGLSSFPMEVIRVVRKPDDNESELELVNLTD